MPGLQLIIKVYDTSSGGSDSTKKSLLKNRRESADSSDDIAVLPLGSSRDYFLKVPVKIFQGSGVNIHGIVTSRDHERL